MAKAKRPELNRKTLRQALRAWDRSEALGESPLAALAIVERWRKQVGYRDSSVGYGLAVRALLQEAIDRLKPDDGPRDPTEKRWRAYLIVTEQYLAGRSKAYLAEQMHVAASTYDHAQAEALDQLLDLLLEWEQAGAVEGGRVADATGAGPSVGRGAPPFLPPPPRPHELVGRQPLLDQLKRRLLGEAAAVRLALHGLPGVGKSSLAIELCHDPQVRSHFADGILWAGLGPRPEPPVQLHLWGLALGFSGEELAPLARIEDRARALHAAIGGRRMLLVLDDVWRADDARSLEVGGPACATLYTTRSPAVATELAGESATLVPELDPAAGLEMIGRLAPQLARQLRRRGVELVEAVGGLPLALELVGGAIRQEAYAGNPRRLIEALDRLADPAERLRLEGARSALQRQPGVPADHPQSLEAAIALSEGALDPPSRSAFRMLSVFPARPNSFSEQAAARVIVGPPRMLDRLVDAGLVEATGADRYALHPVLADYARQGLDGTQAAANLAEYTFEYLERRAHDFAALDGEIANLLAGLEAAFALDRPAQALAAANGLFAYFDASGLIEQAVRLLLRAAKLAEGEGLEAELAATLVNLGRAAQRQADPARAAERYARGLELARRHQRSELECACLQGLGGVAYAQGRFDEARRRYQAGLELAQAAGLSGMQASLLSNLGTLAAASGDRATAEQHYRDGLARARATGDVGMQSTLLTNLGAVLAQAGERAAARGALEESLELARPTGNRRTLSYLLSNLGALAHDEGDHARAVRQFEEALELARQIDDRERTCQLLANLGAVATAQSDFPAAGDHLEEGLRLAGELVGPESTIQLLINRAELAKAQGDSEAARSDLESAHRLAVEAEHPHYLKAIETRLASAAE